MKTKPVTTIEKEDFIKILSSMSVSDINKLIAEKGKPVKPIVPACIVDIRQ